MALYAKHMEFTKSIALMALPLISPFIHISLSLSDTDPFIPTFRWRCCDSGSHREGGQSTYRRACGRRRWRGRRLGGRGRSSRGIASCPGARM
ncbi:hypothetical protein EUGRSUZ_A02152 [Eucalyptus grandis]|uniref:Uncharacterized protein n=2 Tax=Eucalyptus grandis TaxID=71139 RepID=A0A059DI96_EUCGR|nr:hypothetical protein EUGRSUZ_A02152 [Eucalyptus grandis]